MRCVKNQKMPTRWPTHRDGDPLPYLAAVYPAARKHLRALSGRGLNRSFEHLQYLFACDAESLKPPLIGLPICPQLPYLPAGAYYSTAGRADDSINVFSGGNFFRYPEPIEAVHRNVRVAASAAALPHSSYGGRAGPTPAWTSPLVIARYPLYPLGLFKQHAGGVGTRNASTEAGHSDLRVRHVRATLASGGGPRRRAHINAMAHPAVAGLQQLADGDLIEVEQWGGWLTAEQCPPICGLWGNVWRGTGIMMRASNPFVSLNKGTAIVQMLLTLGGRNETARLQALAMEMRIAPHVERLRRKHPSATMAASVAAAVISRNPCPATMQGHRFEEVVGKWMVLTRHLPPDALVSTFLALVAPRAGGRRDETSPHSAAARPTAASAADPTTPEAWLRDFSDAERFGLFWLWGACGVGPLGWDRLLQILACMLGHHTVVLSASSNDNGLLHQELVDFELPAHLGWPPQQGTITNPSVPNVPSGGPPGGPPGAVAPVGSDADAVRYCRDRLNWVQQDRSAREKQRRRAELLAFWERAHKFRMPAVLPEGRTPVVHNLGAHAARNRSAPCALRFGHGDQAEGGIDACSYSFPDGLDTKQGGHKACWAFCDRTLSASNARVSLLHSRAP